MSSIVITTPLIVLKQIDWADCFSLYWVRNHASVRKDLSNQLKKKLVTHILWYYTKQLLDTKSLIFVIKKKNKIVGFTLLRNIDKKRKEAEIGIMLVESHRHPMTATYAMTLTLHFALQCLGLESFYSYASLRNSKAQRFNCILGSPTQSDNSSDLKYIYNKIEMLKRPFYRGGFLRIIKQAEISGDYKKLFKCSQ